MINFLTLISKFKYPLLAAAVAAAVLLFYHLSYESGYEDAVNSMTIKNQQAALAAQEEARETYEKQIEQLNADLANARELNAERLRELERFNNADTDLAACRRDRRELSELAVRGERLLRDAESYIKALK